jgi:hypothetical protein
MKSTTDNISKYSYKERSKNKLLYGIVSVRVYDVKIAQHIFGAIQEYVAFNCE